MCLLSAMATAQVSPDLPRPSFAKVVTGVPKKSSSGSAAVNDTSATTASPTKASDVHGPAVVSGRSSDAPAVDVEEGRNQQEREDEGVACVAASLDDLRLDTQVSSQTVENDGLRLQGQQTAAKRTSSSDDSPRCDSTSDLGGYSLSLDGKSYTSGTTFSLDEKESLKPDDSASVKAGTEDDTFANRHPSALASHTSLEATDGARSSRSVGGTSGSNPAHPPSEEPDRGNPTSQSSSVEQAMPASCGPSSTAQPSSTALNVIYRQAPDDKLLDALASPRDRYFLLRMEKDVIYFLQDSKEPYMDLPPSNYFCRMLTHKLADYYHMTHSYEPHIKSVRIFRTPFCRVPLSLAAMVPQNGVSASSTPLPTSLPRKIMRRGQVSEGGAASTSASMAASETGSDAKEGREKQAPTKEKLSREKREEMYKLARERIFGCSDESVQEIEGASSVSRTSSVSAANQQANAGKRGKSGKQRRCDSESFDSRNQYAPYWGPQPHTWISQAQGHFPPPAPHQHTLPSPMDPSGHVSTEYAHHYCAGYPPMSALPPADLPYPPAPAQSPYSQSFQPMYQHPGSPMTIYGSPVANTIAPQGWQPNPGLAAYHAGHAVLPTPIPIPTCIPYAYGQLPLNTHPDDPKSQHPIPGSYSRQHVFNPNTQSFVPTTGLPPYQPPHPPFAAPGPYPGSPHNVGSHLFRPGGPTANSFYGGDYPMMRQDTNSSCSGSSQMQRHPNVQGVPFVPAPQHPSFPSHAFTRPAGPRSGKQNSVQ